MIDFTQLRAPERNGAVLVIPDPKQWAALARANHAALSQCPATILGEPLHVWRRRTRDALVGSDDRLVIVAGHQPDFIHAGVWAKNIVAHRFAAAVNGSVVDLVVDNDAPKSVHLNVPTIVDGRVALHAVRFANTHSGYSYEQFQPIQPAEIDAIQTEVAQAMGDRYEPSAMPLFFHGLHATAGRGDWVEQIISGRKAVESAFDVAVSSVRVSEISMAGLFVETLVHAGRFADAYNGSLARYRLSNRVRSPGRPIPDLERIDDRIETAWWVYRRDERRRRLFVERTADRLRLYADQDEIGHWGVSDFSALALEANPLFASGGWNVRPRALTLTLWARLFLADLFIHGIGGAKYDRITDQIIHDYFGIRPPTFTCVTGTLRLPLPQGVSDDTIRKLTRQLRDLRHNPQRYQSPDPGLEHLARQRADAIARAADLRGREPLNRPARREAFDRIRSLNAALVNAVPDVARDLRDRIAGVSRDRQSNRIVGSREHFFAMSHRRSLADFIAALPDESAFRV